MKNKICHITTVHPRYDVRIFHKECKSLSEYYDVYLIVADGLGDEYKDNIHIIDIGLRQASRLKRARTDSRKAFKKALELDCELYHYHDPELIKTGAKLKKMGKKVVYDVHEDLPRQIYGKPYLKSFVKPILSFLIEKFENNEAKKVDFIFTATPFIQNRFLKINKNTVDINNYPVLMQSGTIINSGKKEKSICYVGGISQNRGIYELIESMQYGKVTLKLAGKFESENFKEKCMQSTGWKYVKFYGYVSRDEVENIMDESFAGIVTLYPLRNYLDSLPVKMFEYMSAALPVIASDFEYWKKIIEENNCGLCVNPLDVHQIADAVKYLTDHPEEAEKKGTNGLKAVKKKYNWKIEEEKMLNAYTDILAK